MSRPFNKIKTGILMTTLGSLVAILSGLILYLMPASIFNELYPYYSLPGMGSMSTIMRTLYFLQIIGGCISFVGAILARSNPRNGSIVAIVGSIVGAVYIITLIGGVFLYQGSKSPTSAPSYMSEGTGEDMRQKFPDRKSCPVCGAQMPGEAKFCPNCGDPFV